ncbi:hypothetical protein, partial [Vibrio vulnificus]|uniref:hypothetical protein n=1 Tax=Vibrio vulnificus TaxID=672 RepID=UPI003ED93E03
TSLSELSGIHSAASTLERMTSNLKRRNDKRQPRLGVDNKQSISIVVNFRIRARKYHGSPITLLRRYRE